MDVYGTPVTINSNTTWDILNHPSNLLPNYDYREGITVTNGAKLTISGLTNLQMNSNSIILVSDGNLIITNSIIFMGDYSLIRLLGILGTPHSLTMTNSKLKPSGTNWAGIELLQTYWHGTGKIQYLTYPTIDPNGNCSNSQWTGLIYPNIGKVNIENSEIYDAEIGINCAPNTYYGGGVVRVRNSKFYNCKKGIRISDFYDNDYPNASFIDQVYDIKVEEDASLDDIPNREDHQTPERWAENGHSSLPPETNPSIPYFEHLSTGCASNIFNESFVNTTFVSHRKVASSTTYNMRFHYNSWPQINLDENYTSCNSSCVDCSTECDKLTIKTASIKKNFINDDFLKIYPNPSQEQITIDIKNRNWSINAKLKIMDIHGNLIYESKLLDKQTTYNLKDLGLSSGIYAVIIQTKSKTTYKKLIVQ